MQATLASSPAVSVLSDLGLEPAPNRVPMTRAICKLLVDNGLLTGRYELVDGEIISKMGQNRPHANAVMLFTRLLMHLFGDEFVQCQLPIDVGAAYPDINDPEPDIVALARPVEAFTIDNPSFADILLLVEVSDTTLRFDLRNKALLYARAGIAEYWAADLAGRQVTVHRNPSPTGYASVTLCDEHATIAPLSRPAANIRVSDLFPPVQPNVA